MRAMKKLVLVVVIAAIALGGVAVVLADDGPPMVVRAKVLVCHIAPGGESAHTLSLAGPAVGAHLAHGDFLGACE
jgi:hypothetical protein